MCGRLTICGIYRRGPMSLPSPTPTNESAAQREAARSTGGEQLVEEHVIPVIAEELSVTRHTDVTGLLRLTKHVDTEEVELDLDTVRRDFEIERRPIGRLSDEAPPAVRREGEQTIYSVVREVPVVVTRYELVEELVVTPRERKTTQTETVGRRVERVEVERALPNTAIPST